MLPVLPILAVATAAVARPPPAAAVAEFLKSFAPQSPMALMPVPDNNTRVPILLGVMSRCPDALLCESVLDSAFGQTWDIVDINLSFVAQLKKPSLHRRDDSDSNKHGGVTCMHGSEECDGNIQELCAINRSDTQQDWWHFVQCLNFEGKDKIGDNNLAQRCAGVAGIPWEDEPSGNSTRKGIKECVEGQEGIDLLKASVKQSQNLGITKSCTIFISGKQRCVRDGTWKECETGHTVEEFVSYIKDEYQRLSSQGTT